jgi:hypothetical protein
MGPMAGTRSGPPRAAGTAALVAAVLALGGCPAEPPDEPPATEEPVALRVTTVHGAGSIDADTRADLESAVGDVLSAYVVQGFLGDYPRDDFVRSFDSFTSGAARDAARDIDQLTAARFQDAEAVRATRLDARLSFLVERDDVVGATAAVRFGFEATVGGEALPLRLRGRLMLVEDEGTWSVFGYDVTTHDARPVEGEVSS